MSSNFAFNQDFDEEGEEEQSPSYSGREAQIVVIDANISMFAEMEDDEEITCLFKKCLTVVERLLLNRIISSSKDLVSFYF